MLKPLFPNIKEGDYQMPQSKLNEYYKEYTDYYNSKQSDHEDVLLKYLECRPNAVIWISTRNLDKKLEGTGLYKKVVKIETEHMWENIVREIPKMNMNSGSKVKRLYLYWLEVDLMWEGLKVVKNESFDELIYYSRIFLNENTLEFYKRQLPLKETKCSKTWDEFVEKYRQLSLIEQNNMVVMSGMVLYLNNIRTCRDLDILYIRRLDLEGAYDKQMIKVGENWRIRLNRKTIRRGDIVVNPLYYHYYDGVKVMTMEVEMGLRGLRVNRPRAFVDMIMVNLKMDSRYKLPRVKLEGESQLEGFYKKMQNAFKKRYNRQLSIDEIKNLINKYK